MSVDGEIHVRVAGELDVATIHLVDLALLDAESREPTVMVLDLGEVCRARRSGESSK